MRLRFFHLFMSLLLVFGSMSAGADGRLSKQKGCASCHGGVRGVVVMEEMHAPPVRQIAARYRGQPNAESELLRKMADKKHPEVKASDAERQKLVRYFLAQ